MGWKRRGTEPRHFCWHNDRFLPLVERRYSDDGRTILKVDRGVFCAGHRAAGLFSQSVLVSVHGIRRAQPNPIGFHKLVSDDDFPSSSRSTRAESLAGEDHVSEISTMAPDCAGFMLPVACRTDVPIFNVWATGCTDANGNINAHTSRRNRAPQESSNRGNGRWSDARRSAIAGSTL